MENNKRDKESLKSYFSQIDAQSLILCAPTDIGVRRNNGRNGARFAPKAILSCIKKMNYSQDLATPIQIEEVSSQLKESSDFHSAQVESAKQILNTSFYRYKRVLHIGGGHDHAFPLLTAINEDESIKELLIVNLDAHCDTRVSDKRHSGTPFRDYSKITNKKSTLIQYGLHHFANSESTQSKLGDNVKEEKLFINESTLSNLKQKIEKLNISKEAYVYISLDADALSASIMEGVSAVNHNGLSLENVMSVMNFLKDSYPKTVFGIYEYNPVYDNLSQKGARAIAALIYEYLR